MCPDLRFMFDIEEFNELTGENKIIYDSLNRRFLVKTLDCGNEIKYKLQILEISLESEKIYLKEKNNLEIKINKDYSHYGYKFKILGKYEKIIFCIDRHDTQKKSQI